MCVSIETEKASEREGGRERRGEYVKHASSTLCNAL